MIRTPRITQAFPVDRRTLIKSAGFAAAGFAAFPLAGCKAQDASMLDSTDGSNPLAIPPLQRGEIEQGARVFRLSLTPGQKEFVTGVASPTIGIDGGGLSGCTAVTPTSLSLPAGCTPSAPP